MKFSLYDLLEGGRLVYVGMTSRPRQRLWEHIARGTIGPCGAMEVVAQFESRSEAERAERARIKELNPQRNRLKPSDRPSKQEVSRVRELSRHAAYAATWSGVVQAADAAFGAQCKQWKKDGMTVREIRDRVKSEFKISLSQQTVWKYVKRKP